MANLVNGTKDNQDEDKVRIELNSKINELSKEGIKNNEDQKNSTSCQTNDNEQNGAEDVLVPSFAEPENTSIQAEGSIEQEDPRIEQDNEPGSESTNQNGENDLSYEDIEDDNENLSSNETDNSRVELDRRFFIENGRLKRLKVAPSADKIKKLTNQSLAALSKKLKRNKSRAKVSSKTKPSTRQGYTLNMNNVDSNQGTDTLENTIKNHLPSLRNRHYHQHLPLSSMVHKLVLNKWGSHNNTSTTNEAQYQALRASTLKKISQQRKEQQLRNRWNLNHQSNIMDNPLGYFRNHEDWPLRESDIPFNPLQATSGGFGEIFNNWAASEDSPSFSSASQLASMSAQGIRSSLPNNRIIPVEIIGLDPEATRSILYSNNNNEFADHYRPPSPLASTSPHLRPIQRAPPPSRLPSNVHTMKHSFKDLNAKNKTKPDESSEQQEQASQSRPEQKVVHIHYFHNQPAKFANTNTTQIMNGSTSGRFQSQPGSEDSGSQQHDDSQQILVSNDNLPTDNAQIDDQRQQVTTIQSNSDLFDGEREASRQSESNEVYNHNQHQMLQFVDSSGRPISINGSNLETNRGVKILISDQHGQPIGILANPSSSSQISNENQTSEGSRLLMISYQPQNNSSMIQSEHQNPSYSSRYQTKQNHHPTTSDYLHSSHRNNFNSIEQQRQPTNGDQFESLNQLISTISQGNYINNHNAQIQALSRSRGPQNGANFANEAASSEARGIQATLSKFPNLSKQLNVPSSATNDTLTTNLNFDLLKQTLGLDKKPNNNGYSHNQMGDVGGKIQAKNDLTNLIVRGQVPLSTNSSASSNTVKLINLSFHNLMGPMHSTSVRPNGELEADTRLNSDHKTLAIDGHFTKLIQSNGPLNYESFAKSHQRAQTNQQASKSIRTGANHKSNPHSESSFDMDYHTNGPGNIALAFIFVLSLVTLAIIVFSIIYRLRRRSLARSSGNLAEKSRLNLAQRTRSLLKSNFVSPPPPPPPTTIGQSSLEPQAAARSNSGKTIVSGNVNPMVTSQTNIKSIASRYDINVNSNNKPSVNASTGLEKSSSLSTFKGSLTNQSKVNDESTPVIGETSGTRDARIDIKTLNTRVTKPQTSYLRSLISNNVNKGKIINSLSECENCNDQVGSETYNHSIRQDQNNGYIKSGNDRDHSFMRLEKQSNGNQSDIGDIKTIKRGYVQKVASVSNGRVRMQTIRSIDETCD